MAAFLRKDFNSSSFKGEYNNKKQLVILLQR